jgi:hypothetical protein
VRNQVTLFKIQDLQNAGSLLIGHSIRVLSSPPTPVGFGALFALAYLP